MSSNQVRYKIGINCHFASQLDRSPINIKSKMAYQQDRGGFQPRQMVQGDWKCSKCAADIKELPFNPDPSRLDQLLCRNCHRESRPPRREFRRDR